MDTTLLKSIRVWLRGLRSDCNPNDSDAVLAELMRTYAVQATDWIDEINVCLGTPQSNSDNTCKRCKGKGHVFIINGESTRNITCPICDGEGYTEPETGRAEAERLNAAGGGA